MEMAHIRKRNGKWIAEIRKKDFKKIQKTFLKKSNANNWVQEIEYQMDKNQYQDFSDSSKFTLGDLIKKYRDEITINNAATTSSTSSNVNFVSNKYISDTWASYRSSTPSENDNDDYQDDTYWPAFGGRYGLDPQHAQANGSFYIDCKNNKIHFSSNISGKTVILDYISDGLYGGESSKVPKFVEEAIYKWIAHAILASRANTPEFIVARFKKERFAEIRKAKLRLSNIKLHELTQVLRGKSKLIKH